LKKTPPMAHNVRRNIVVDFVKRKRRYEMNIQQESLGALLDHMLDKQVGKLAIIEEINRRINAKINEGKAIEVPLVMRSGSNDKLVSELRESLGKAEKYLDDDDPKHAVGELTITVCATILALERTTIK
jgi:hypothetical protein